MNALTLFLDDHRCHSGWIEVSSEGRGVWKKCPRCAPVVTVLTEPGEQ